MGRRFVAPGAFWMVQANLLLRLRLLLDTPGTEEAARNTRSFPFVLEKD